MSDLYGIQIIEHDVVDEHTALLIGVAPDPDDFESEAEWFSAWGRRCARIEVSPDGPFQPLTR